MQYGYFKDREYIITRPDTKKPWCNYLGSPEYGAIISNNAAGYSFEKSGADGRILRFRFNANMGDFPGRYIYIRDNDTNDYFSNSWCPVCKDLNKYKSECRHGTGYTKIISSYENIETSTLYYVPLDKTYEVWNFSVKNTGEIERDLSIFSFAEFTNSGNYEQDLVNLQYTQLISKTYYYNNIIIQAINENGSEAKSDSSGINNESTSGIFKFIAAAGVDACGFDGDRDTFIGDYRSYRNPVAVEKGKCSNTLNYNENSCGSMQFNITLKPNEEKVITFILGNGGKERAESLKTYYEDKNNVESEIREIIHYWHNKLDKLTINTPCESFNHIVNTWNAYQCFITFTWSRAASLSYCGLRNGYGYRDTVQDIQGIIHLEPGMAYEKIRFMLSAQTKNGGGVPLVKFGHKPGDIIDPSDGEYGTELSEHIYRADDALWLFPTIERYIKESGNIDFLDEVIPFADGGSATVYEHLKCAIQFSLDRLGKHGLTAGLFADWNDCLRLGSDGESVFTSQQLYLGLVTFEKIAEFKKSEADINWCRKLKETTKETINKHAFEGDRFVRGITENGYVIGSKNNDEASLWLNTQSWAVISGLVGEEQGKIVMDTVYENLNTEYGVMLFYPTIKKFGLPIARMILFNPSTKENGGIFSQSQGWAVLAEAMLGRGNKAFEYFQKTNPAAMNERAEVRELEPYAHGQSIESKDSPYEGRAQVHWLTGTASTVMVSAVNGILGLNPDFNGIRINPSIPSDWTEFTMVKNFRDKILNIKVENKNNVEHGVTKIILNGKEFNDSFIPFDELHEQNEVLVIMG